MAETLLERTFTFCEEHKPATALPMPAKRMLDIRSQVQRCEDCREATKQAARLYAAIQAKKGFPRPDQGKWWYEFPLHVYGSMTVEERWQRRLKQYMEAGRGS